MISFKSSLPAPSPSDNVVIVAVGSMIPSPLHSRYHYCFRPKNPLQHTVHRPSRWFKTRVSSAGVGYTENRLRSTGWSDPYIIMQNETRSFCSDRLIYFCIHKIRHESLFCNRILLQRLRTRDRLILIRRHYSTKMTFLVDVIRSLGS
jgi:hypothetical protein